MPRSRSTLLSVVRQGVVAGGMEGQSDVICGGGMWLVAVFPHPSSPALLVADPLPASQGGPLAPPSLGVSVDLRWQTARGDVLQASTQFRGPVPLDMHLFSPDTQGYFRWLGGWIQSFLQAFIVSPLHWGDSMGLPLWACFRAPPCPPTDRSGPPTNGGGLVAVAHLICVTAAQCPIVTLPPVNLRWKARSLLRTHAGFEA
ncbi:uncharacterized protein B0H64DRAFT_22551 [Chaetomium fimeti]|uniref:Uncharacterized protein n=1 Tax=Chaetomium fimeti TaxID=1854472 RepID=A0AAE0HQA2_9PEZI|nr:hypothetical protein B0H64DRAFT_22551 [Chaetomium fimeti]